MIGRIGLIVLGAAAAAALTTVVPGVHSRLEQLAGAPTVAPPPILTRTERITARPTGTTTAKTSCA